MVSARHRINHMAIGMRSEHFLHSVASAKHQVACRVKLTEASAQNRLRRRVTVVTSHHGKPIEKQSHQRQMVPSCCFSRNVTQPAFRQRKDHVRFEILDDRFQRGLSCQGPDKVLVIGGPCCQSRSEPAFSHPIDKVRQPERRVHQIIVDKVCLTGDV